MQAHQPLERGRLVVRVVVDVQVGVALEPLVHEVDELLERALLLRAVVAPEGVKPRLALVDRDRAEQVLEPVLVERVALHVEEEVALGGRRQEREAPALLGLEQLVRGRAGAALVELQARLIGEASRTWPARPSARPCRARASASCSRVVMPTRLMRSDWALRIPATRQRWSSAMRWASQRSAQRQSSQCGTGFG